MFAGGCRTEVRLQSGCKIYFDPVSTAAREDFARQVARQVCADPSCADTIDTVRLQRGCILSYNSITILLLIYLHRNIVDIMQKFKKAYEI